MFGTCVYFCKKSWTYVRKINFLIWTELPISLRCSSSLPLSLLFPHRMTKPLHSKISIDASEHPRLDWASQLSAELHGRRSMFEDPARDRAWFAADLALQDPGSNLTFTFFVNGFWSKEWRVPQTEKLFFGFCFLFLLFITNRENPFFLFFVCCWDGALIYNPNIDAVHCRNL